MQDKKILTVACFRNVMTAPCVYRVFAKLDEVMKMILICNFSRILTVRPHNKVNNKV
jgi:hypothetical protein